MLTLVVYAVLALVVVTALVAVAVLLLPGTEQLAPAPGDRTPWALPTERAMTGPDVGRLRLPVTLRGYRFAETDAVLDRLGEEIAYRDEVIAALRAELAGDARPPAAAQPVPEDQVVTPPVVEQSEPAEPTEPTEPTEATEAAEPAEPTAEEPSVELGETPEETEGR